MVSFNSLLIGCYPHSTEGKAEAQGNGVSCSRSCISTMDCLNLEPLQCRDSLAGVLFLHKDLCPDWEKLKATPDISGSTKSSAPPSNQPSQCSVL